MTWPEPRPPRIARTAERGSAGRSPSSRTRPGCSTGRSSRRGETPPDPRSELLAAIRGPAPRPEADRGLCQRVSALGTFRSRPPMILESHQVKLGASPCHAGQRSSAGSAVELRREESRRGLQDLVGPPQLAVLALQRLEPLALVTGQPRAEAVIGLSPADPLAQRLSGDPKLVRDGGDHRPLGGVLVLVLEHQPDGPLPQLLGIPAWSCHGSNLSRVGASRNPGAVHFHPWSELCAQYDSSLEV